MTRFRSEKVAALFLKGLIVLVVWGVIGFGVWKYLGEEWGAKSDVTVFEPEVQLYTAAYPFLDPPLEGGGYIRAKAVVVDVTDSAVLPLTFALSPDIAARDPAEVGTVIQVERLLQQVATYADQTPAYRQNALVRLVDIAAGCTLGEAFIEGNDPPETKAAGKPGFGDVPDGQIPDLLASLPRITWDGSQVVEASAQTTARGGLPGGYGGSAFQASPFVGDGSMRRADALGARAETASKEKSRASDIVKRLAPGMSIDDTIAYLGLPQSRGKIGAGNHTITECTWQLPDGSTLTCDFHTDGLHEWKVE